MKSAVILPNEVPRRRRSLQSISPAGLGVGTMSDSAGCVHKEKNHPSMFEDRAMVLESSTREKRMYDACKI